MTGVTQDNGIRRVFALLMVAILAVMPVYVALAEIQATPIVEPTPTPAAAPVTPEPTETTESIGTPDATPNMQSSSVITPMSITAGEDALSGCIQTIGTAGVIYPSSSVQFECDLDFSRRPRPVVEISLIGQVNTENFSATSPNFTASVVLHQNLLGLEFLDIALITGRDLSQGNGGGSAQVLVPLLAILGGVNLTSTKVTFTIIANENVQPGESFETTFTACRRGLALLDRETCTAIHGAATVSLQVPVEEPLEGEDSDYTFECEDGGSADIHGIAVSTCTLGVGTGLGTRSIRVDRILAPQAAGLNDWDFSLIDMNDQVLISAVPGSYTFNSDHPVVSSSGSDQNHFQFRVLITPTMCHAPGSGPSIDVQLGLMLLQGDRELGNGDETDPKTVTSSFAATGKGAVVLDSSAANASVDYSLIEQTPVKAELFFNFEVNGCVPQRVSASMTEFAWDVELSAKPDPGGNVPELSRTYHHDDQENPSVSEIEINGPLTKPDQQPTPLITVSTSEDGTKVVGSHRINIEYTIPANTPVGTYTSTIIVTISDAPD